MYTHVMCILEVYLQTSSLLRCYLTIPFVPRVYSTQCIKSRHININDDSQLFEYTNFLVHIFMKKVLKLKSCANFKNCQS